MTEADLKAKAAAVVDPESPQYKRRRRVVYLSQALGFAMEVAGTAAAVCGVDSNALIVVLITGAVLMAGGLHAYVKTLLKRMDATSAFSAIIGK